MGCIRMKKPDLAREIRRLMKKTELSREEVYAFLCGGSVGTAGFPALDRKARGAEMKRPRIL